MKKIMLLAVAAIMTTASFAQQVWTADKAHSKLGFTVTHLGISEVDGTFKSFDAKMMSSKEDFTDAVFEMTADMTAITTNNEMRDGHLQKADMFDGAKFPTMTFKSTGITKTADKKYTLTGNLTMKGVTKPVTFDLTLLGTTAGKDGKKVAGFKVAGTIKRTDFGVGSMPSLIVSDNVDLRGSGEFKAS